jgi:hypothetical protein
MDKNEFDLLEQTLRSDGPEAVFDRLIRRAREEKDSRVLFGARMMQVRHRLGLPLIETEPVGDLGGVERPAYETAFREAAREAGELLLAAGEIIGAWPYFKAIGEPAPVAAAIENVSPDNVNPDNVNPDNVNQGEKLDRVIEIAFQEGVNPRKGFELILEHRGICSAITWFGYNRDFGSRQLCLRLLVRTLYSQVASALKETIASAEGAAPETDRVAELIAGRAWLFEGTSSYTDSTHLTSVLRFTPELEDAGTLRMALELAEYGLCLDPMFHFRGDPPFENTYHDHAMYLRALLGQDVETAIAHFRQKAGPPAAMGGDTAAAEVFIDLLVQLKRYAEAIQASVEYLPDANSTPLSCPSALQLCQMAGDYARLRSLARQSEDLLGFVAGVIQG